jgi:hypothetical protein
MNNRHSVHLPRSSPAVPEERNFDRTKQIKVFVSYAGTRREIGQGKKKPTRLNFDKPQGTNYPIQGSTGSAVFHFCEV